MVVGERILVECSAPLGVSQDWDFPTFEEPLELQAGRGEAWVTPAWSFC